MSRATFPSSAGSRHRVSARHLKLFEFLESCAFCRIDQARNRHVRSPIGAMLEIFDSRYRIVPHLERSHRGMPFESAQRGALFLGRRGCAILLPLSFRWQPNIATNAKLNVVTRRWREHFPYSTLPCPPPALQPPYCAADFFPLFSSWLSFH
jgi:hypothetical protein